MAAESTFFRYDKKSLPDRAAFGDHDVVVLKHETSHELMKDGRTRHTVRRAWMYLSEFGREHHSDVPVAFRAGLQKLTVSRAVTYMAGGKETPTPDYARNEIVPFPLDRAPDTADVRQMMISLVGTEAGAVSVLEYSIEDEKPWKTFFFGEEKLGDQFPVIERSVSVSAPAGTPLAAASRAGAAPPQKNESGGLVKYTWNASKLPAFDPEDRQPGWDLLIPSAVFTSKPGWEDLSAAFTARFAEAAGSGEQLKAMAEAAVSGVEDKFLKALKLHKKILKGVRSIECRPSLLDFSFRPALRVWESGYGTQLEKAVLLAAAAKAAGFGARAFLSFHEAIEVSGAAFPGMEAGALVEIGAGGRKIVLDPAKAAHEVCADRLENVRLFCLSEPSTSPESAKTSRPGGKSELSVEAALKPDLSIEGKVRCSLEGFLNPYARFSADENSKADALASEIASKFFGGKAENLGLELFSPEGTILRFDLKAGKANRLEGGFVLVEWPDAPAAVHGFLPPFHRGSRTTPLQLPGSAEFSLNLKLTLPKDAKARILPQTVKNRGGASKLDAACEEKDGAVSVDCKWKFPRKMVMPEDYEKFRAAAAASANPENRRILISGI